MANRPESGGNAAAGLSTGRVVEAVLVDAVGRVVVDEERVVLDVAPGGNVVVVVLVVGVVNRARVVVDGRALGLRS